MDLDWTVRLEMMALSALLFGFVVLIQAQQRPTASPPHSLADWQQMMPSVREALKHQFPDEHLEQPSSVAILREGHVADVTGDDIPEAIVSFGLGGASTSQITLMRFENGNPMVAEFKDRSGKTAPMVFSEGASVMHTDRLDLMPEEHAVFAIHYEYGSTGKLQECGGQAYRWNPSSKTFDFDPALTKRLSRSACSQVPKRAG